MLKPPAPTATVPLAVVPASSTPTPTPPTIVASPACAQASPTPAHLAMSVVVIESDDDEDTEEGVVFKRRRKLVVTPSHSSTYGRPSSFREHPPSALSPHGLLVFEGGGESALASEHTPCPPELPAVLQHTLKGFQRGVTEDLDEDAARARLGLSFGELLAQSNAS